MKAKNIINLLLELNDTYSLNKLKKEQIYIMIVKIIKRVILKVNKYHKQLWLELKDTYSLNNLKTLNLYYDSDRDKEYHIESKETSWTLRVTIKWHLQSKQVQNRVDLYYDNDRGKESHIESKETS